MKVKIGIIKCTGIMGQDLVHPYIQSTTVLFDRDIQVELCIKMLCPPEDNVQQQILASDSVAPLYMKVFSLQV